MCFGGGSEPSGQQTTVVQNNAAPWGPQGTQLQHILSEARRLYDLGPQTPLPYSPQSEQALRMTEERALAGSPLIGGAQDELQRNLSGEYLAQGNPYFQQMFNRVSQPVVQRFTQAVAPGIDSQFSRAGRLGSGAYAEARNTAEETLARELGSLAGSMAGQQYGQERGRMMQAASMAPGMASQDYEDASRLAGVGAAREQLAEREAMKDYEHLARFLGITGGNYGQASTSTQTVPIYSNPAATFLGGAATGAGLGLDITGGSGWGAGIGGLLGGLLGFL